MYTFIHSCGRGNGARATRRLPNVYGHVMFHPRPSPFSMFPSPAQLNARNKSEGLGPRLGLGTLWGYEAKIHVDPSIKPRFCQARTVPYSMRTLVDHELDCLTQQGIIEPIQYADSAAPIVPVLKTDKSIRICGDFKLTVNRASKLDRYSIPKIEDLFAKIAGGHKFTQLDMSQAYQQLPLDERSKEFVVINTQRELFKYNRLPFCVSSAPGIFQSYGESAQGNP